MPSTTLESAALDTQETPHRGKVIAIIVIVILVIAGIAGATYFFFFKSPHAPSEEGTASKAAVPARPTAQDMRAALDKPATTTASKLSESEINTSLSATIKVAKQPTKGSATTSTSTISQALIDALKKQN